MTRTFKKRTIDQDVYTLSVERIARAFDRFDHIAVFFSGGKDSTVCLELALAEAKRRGRVPLDVVFFDEEAIHPETIEYMERTRVRDGVALRWYCLPIQHRNACSKRSPYWNPWAPEDQAKWCRPLPPHAITELPGFTRQPLPELNPLLFGPELGQVGVIVGLRAAESLRRYRAVAQRVHDNYISPIAPSIYLVKPIYDWSTTDVWTAPHLLGWDYNRTYDVMTKAGISRHQQRVCPPYGEEPLGGLWQYAVCWPDLWGKMTARVPGAATAGRYCRSPLYGFAGTVSPQPGETWPSMIQAQLRKWPPSIATQVAHRISKFMAIHNQQTAGAPLVDGEHPVSGVGWRFLYTIALRGDLKERRDRKIKERDAKSRLARREREP